MFAEEAIVSGDLNGQAVGMDGAGAAAFATLGSLAGARITGLSGQGNVVVQELAPSHQEDGNGVIMETIIGMDGAGDETGSGQRSAAGGYSENQKKSWLLWRLGKLRNAMLPGCADAIGVIGGHEAVMGVHSRSPMRMLNVVTYTGNRTITLNLTLGGHEESGAIALHNGLGGVNEGEAVGDGVLAEAVLLGNVTSGLLNDGTQVADFFRREF